MTKEFEHHVLRAPREDGAALINPPQSAAGHLVAENVERARHYQYDVQGRGLGELAREGRRELVAQAHRYTRAYRDTRLGADVVGPLLLAGHQPQLFHPGVWFKNFVLGRLAARLGGTSVNLVIDSDAVKSTAVRVPGGTAMQPLVEVVKFDEPSLEMAYEERLIACRQCMTGFGAHAAEVIAPLVPDPLLRQFWPLVLERMKDTANLGACLAQARHQLEGAWGLETLELPQSQVCNLEAFYWFTSHLLARLPRLWDAYNTTVADYRRANHIRSRAHPVPDLAMDDDWLEAPFWIWTTADPKRRRLFVRQSGEQLVLSDRKQLQVPLGLSPESDARRAVAELAGLAARGIKLRTRALVTTMFARLVLSDAFIHGIGGAKYDEVTDVLIERFFGLRPPGFMTVSATLRLPIRRDRPSADDARRLEAQLRELSFHPERFLEEGQQDERTRALVATKRRWIATPQTSENARERCRAIREVNEQLQSSLAPARLAADQRRQTMAQDLRSEAVLSSREYAFCLFPEATLRPFLDQQ